MTTKRAAFFLAGTLLAGCQTSGSLDVGTPTQSSAPAAGNVSVTLTSAASDYKAAFRKEGGMQVPIIPLVMVVKNAGDSAWKCDGAITLAADAQRGKTSATRSFLTTLSPCELAPGAEHREELEAGEFLTEIAGRFMKGDRLAVRAAIAPSAQSAPVTIDVFVPEG